MQDWGHEQPDVIGVDVGGTKILALLLRADGTIAGEARVPTPRGGEAVLDAIAEVVTRLGTSIVGTSRPATPMTGTPTPGTPPAGMSPPDRALPGMSSPGMAPPGMAPPGMSSPISPPGTPPNPGTPNPGTPNPGTPNPGTPNPGTPSTRGPDSRAPVTAVGVGAPGLVDHAGVLRFAPNLPHVVGLPVRDGLEQRLPGVVVTVDNDATCAGWAERVLGAGQGSDDLLMVTLGTGIGGGLVARGQVVRGGNGFAGEIGHMVVDIHGPPCPCGKRGCWERFASGSGLGRLGREAAEAGLAPRIVEMAGGDPVAVRGEHVTAAAVEGDADALGVVASFAWWVALGLANLANVFDPECIVLGGGLVVAGGLFLEPVRRAFRDLVEAAEHRPDIRIVLAQLGERSGAVGAALLARAARDTRDTRAAPAARAARDTRDTPP